MNKNNRNKLIASILCANMLLICSPFEVLAESNISGFDQKSGTYNIEAAKVSGSTGFRYYENFQLGKNDIANLIYKDGNGGYSKFVN